MRIATYNIWNSQDGMPYREKHIIEEIKKLSADVLCLQEVCNREMAENISKASNYNFCYFENYFGEDEGLAILSKKPFIRKVTLLDRANALIGLFEVCGKTLCVVNIHLPWNSPINRTKQILDINLYLDEEQFDYAILAGDFNCSEMSDVNRFLLGECLLDGRETECSWFDLALSYAEHIKSKPECTLNFAENPRFVNNTIEINSRVDRIMLRNPYPEEFPILKDCHIFGQNVYNETKLAASDHYGVSVDIEFKK